MKTQKTITHAILLLLSAGSISAQTTVYNFENLNPGTISGQDNWIGTHYYGTQAYVANGTGANTTKIATNDLMPDSADSLRRVNNGTFSFLSFTGTETQAFIQFDFRKPTADSSGEASAFRFGIDVDSSGFLEFDESRALRYQNGSFTFDNSNIGPGVSRSSVGAGNFDDWYRFRLLMDFTANAGQGLGTTFYQNLTRGDTEFTQLTSGSLQLGTLEAGAQPQFWNTVQITAQRGSGADNLTVGVVPEPSATFLILAGAASASLFRRRNKA
jgi:hypothetical protein